MKKIFCEALLYSNSRHLEQVFTGLGNLEKMGVIELKIKQSGLKDYQKGLGSPVLKLLLNKKTMVLIDTQDSHQLYNQEELVGDVDFYFKRAYLKGGYSNKSFEVRPLGFNYAIQGSNNHTIQRAIKGYNIKKGLELCVRNSLVLSRVLNINGSRAYCNESNLYDVPRFNDKYNTIVFMTRLWPAERAKDPEEKIRRQHLNYMRTECIRGLKKEFKSKFVGGLFVDEYSSKTAPDCLLVSNKLAKRNNYYSTLRDATIAITSSGKHAVGWSIGEYISLSKAIVAETLMDDVPGDFLPNNNYLAFDSPDSCVNCCQLLLNNSDLRYSMMMNNNKYYHNFLKPESLMLNVFNESLI